MNTPAMLSIAQAAYEAYGDSIAWTNFQGGPLPRWDELRPAVQESWVRAGFAAITAWRALTTPEKILVESALGAC